MKIRRRRTREISLGGVKVGGRAPVTVQSMTKTPLEDVRATIRQCRRLAEAGCEIVRIAVPTPASAAALRKIRREVPIPIVADVHFDYRSALAAIEAGADGVRINPGTIGRRGRIAVVARAAAAAGVPVRVGVNSGSLERRFFRAHGRPTPEALVESALECARRIEDAGCELIKISAKASSVLDTIRAYELLSKATRYPLHVGVTEAGPPLTASVRSAIGIGHLLLKGIGDTIRVSVTGDPVEEVLIGREILQSLGLRVFGPTLISCPACGRARTDLVKIVGEIQEALAGVTKGITVAVMGCAVNGPGEAREADVGLAAGSGRGLIFRRGRVVRKVREDEFVRALMEEIENMGDAG